MKRGGGTLLFLHKKRYTKLYDIYNILRLQRFLYARRFFIFTIRKMGLILLVWMLIYFIYKNINEKYDEYSNINKVRRRTLGELRV